MPVEARIHNWKPNGVSALEPAAEDAVRAEKSTLVIAGPGAGKTELLAQRACFLLQTRACISPRRILAISFKRDAARNLRDRVVRRCGRELASRFDSYTFDSFAKGLVDRFIKAIPDSFRPTSDYIVLDGSTLNERRVPDLVAAIPSGQCSLTDGQIHALNQKALWKALIARPLPVDGHWANTSDEEIAAAELWRYLLHGRSVSSLGFPMLARLAELVLQTNPLVLAALRKSYQFVFLDEFQDTALVHYSLTRTAFLGSNAVLTAVGDGKQRIMVWAGALSGIFKTFKEEFDTLVLQLQHNYRSAKELVSIQAVVAKAMDNDAIAAVSMTSGEGGPGECRALSFPDEATEAQLLAERIANWIRVDGLKPRDICILCRMKPAEYTDRLRAALAGAGVRSRIENELQDLLAEPLSECLLNMLKLACHSRAPEAWNHSLSVLSELNGDYSDSGVRHFVEQLLSFTRTLRQSLALATKDEPGVLKVLGEIVSFIGEKVFRTANPQYLQDAWYSSVLNQLTKAICDRLQMMDWPSTIDDLEGIDSIPIMTTHKSKGLEYHTVVFVGLEDSALWGFANNPSEETCGFFVALSRAKNRVIFTFSAHRTDGRGRYRAQNREVLSPLYDLLQQAGIAVENG